MPGPEKSVLESSEKELKILEDTQRATLNILEDFNSEKNRLEEVLKAALNILEDFNLEKSTLEGNQRATINILEDFDSEKNRLEETLTATVNIIDDFNSEKTWLEDTQRATLNILEDFNSVKTKVEVASYELLRQIGERKQAEDELKRVNQLLKEHTSLVESANKEIESFSYSVSHDLRAPLRAIDGFSQALLEEYSDKLDEEGKNHLERVRAGCKKMSQLIDDMLNLSRLSRAEMKPQKVNLTALAQEIISELKNTEPERKVEVEIPDNLFVNCDLQLIRAVLENLLRNAWKYTSKHPTANIEFSSKRENGKIIFYVKDDGSGFDMKYVDKLFGAFQRLHRMDEFEGNGIGLAIVKRIIHRHGGEVWAEGEVDKGATFYFTL